MYGVISPLLLITIISMFFGHLLSWIESPQECDGNDEILASRNAVESYKDLVNAIVTTAPFYCYETVVDKDLESAMEAKMNSVLNTVDAGPTGEDRELAMGIEEMADIVSLLSEAVSRHTGRNIEHLLPAGGNSSGIHSILDSHTDTAASSVFTSDTDQVEIDSYLNAAGVMVVNTTEMAQHMKQCGTDFRRVVDTLYSKYEEQNSANSAGSLTFNWNRCLNHSEYPGGLVGEDERTASLPENQVAFYSKMWNDDQQQLYETYLSAYESNSTSDGNGIDLADRIRAYQRSLEEATGRGLCIANSPASAWFWFTVMTTMGYGNYAPETEGGRCMLYTLGLFSLLVFAAYLGTTGNIITFLWDDLLLNAGFKPIESPWVGFFFWGVLWYTWMAFVALYAQFYWLDRMELSESNYSFRDAYWYGYISTTTIGLGDYYPQPEELYFGDVFAFSILMSLGFALLSSFLGSWGDILSKHAPKTGEEFLKERLGDPLENWEKKNAAVEGAEAGKENDTNSTNDNDSTVDEYKKKWREVCSNGEKKEEQYKDESQNVSDLQKEREILMKVLKSIDTELDETAVPVDTFLTNKITA